jgi:lysozyme
LGFQARVAANDFRPLSTTLSYRTGAGKGAGFPTKLAFVYDQLRLRGQSERLAGGCWADVFGCGVRMSLKDQLRRHEGTRTHPYYCTSGKITIGVGRNLTDRGLEPDIIRELFRRDVASAKRQAAQILGDSWRQLNVPRQDAVTNMVYQLGMGGVSRFKKFLIALKAHDYELAASEMLDSKWAARDTPGRALELAEQMRVGRYRESNG